MKTLSLTELRANLSAVMDRVNDDHEPVIVHRAKGKPGRAGCFGIGRAPCRNAQVYQIMPEAAGFSDIP